MLELVGVILTCIALYFGQDGVRRHLDRPQVGYLRTHILPCGDGFIHGIIVYNKGKRIAEDVTLQVALTNGIIKGKPLVYSYYMEEIPVTQKEQGILIKYPKVISGSERKQEVYLITTQKEEPVIDVWHGAEIIKPEEQVFNRSWIEHVLIFSGLFLWSLLVVVPVMYIIFASLGYF